MMVIIKSSYDQEKADGLLLLARRTSSTIQEEQEEEADGVALTKKPSQNQFQDLTTKKQSADNTVSDASAITEATLFGSDPIQD